MWASRHFWWGSFFLTSLLCSWMISSVLDFSLGFMGGQRQLELSKNFSRRGGLWLYNYGLLTTLSNHHRLIYIYHHLTSSNSIQTSKKKTRSSEDQLIPEDDGKNYIITTIDKKTKHSDVRGLSGGIAEVEAEVEAEAEAGGGGRGKGRGERKLGTPQCDKVWEIGIGT